MLYIFPTSRAIRSFYASFKEDTLLPQAITIAEFETKATFIPSLIQANDDTRTLLMRECCHKDVFNSLHIPQNFLAFLNNSNYLFRFFEELSLEGRSCSDLRGLDVYGEFEEHLSILEVLHKNYIAKLEEKGFYDTITFPKLYRLNSGFLKNFNKVFLHIDGYLNGFEWELFKKITQFCQVTIQININQYNQKMATLFEQDGISLTHYGEYLINLNAKTFTCKESKSMQTDISVKRFSLRSLQIGYVLWQIQTMLKDGIELEKIAVILPDESFANLLKSYDKANNLNFAMGFSFSKTLFMQKLNAIVHSIENPSLATSYKEKRFAIENSVRAWKEVWGRTLEFEDFTKKILSIEKLKKEEQRLVDEELYALQKLFARVKLKFSELVKLLLNRLSVCSLDDVRGGKVTVLGALETRGASFEGVIIVDFNDNFIPRPSQKDMFLSTKLRYHANLPTKYDRENLQRYYYYQIIKKAKKVAISYTQNEENLPSRFLNSLSFSQDNEFDEHSYATLLLKSHRPKNIFTCKDLILQNDILSYPLSASRLSAYLTCPRCYYFRYILKLQDEDVPSEELSPLDVGNALHVSLHELYQEKQHFSSAKSLHVKLCQLLDTRYVTSPLWELEREIWKNRLELFCENEIKRFEEGWSPYKLEESFTFSYNDVVLEGKIDRIDRHKSGSLAILDYKSGKVEIVNEKNIDKMSDFQMQFYYLFGTSLGKVDSCGFYDLTYSKIVNESYMEAKIQQLDTFLEELATLKEIDFKPNEKKCKYSPYTILCDKEE